MIVSPISLFTALSMISIGARGLTLKELLDMLYIKTDTLIGKGEMAKMLESLKGVICLNIFS